MGDSADMGRLKLARKRNPVLNQRLVNIQRAGISAAAGRGDISPLRARAEMLDLGIHPTLKKQVQGKGDDWINKLLFQTGMGIPRMIGNTANSALHPKRTAEAALQSVLHPVAAAKQAVKQNPGDLLVGALLGGLGGGPEALAARAASVSAKRGALAPVYDPMNVSMMGAHLRPTIPLKGKGPNGAALKGWRLERSAPVDDKRTYITHTGNEGELHTTNSAYNLIGPSQTRKKGEAMYGSITFNPSRKHTRTEVGEMYVADDARKALGSLTGLKGLADAAWRGGGQKSFETSFANKRLALLAKLSNRRNWPYFKGVDPSEFNGMGLEQPGRELWDPNQGALVNEWGDLVDPSSGHVVDSRPPPGVEPDNYFNLETGELHPGLTRDNVPPEVWNWAFPEDPVAVKARTRKANDFGGTRGTGNWYEPNTIVELPGQRSRAAQLAQALVRRSY